MRGMVLALQEVPQRSCNALPYVKKTQKKANCDISKTCSTSGHSEQEKHHAQNLDRRILLQLVDFIVPVIVPD